MVLLVLSVLVLCPFLQTALYWPLVCCCLHFPADSYSRSCCPSFKPAAVGEQLHIGTTSSASFCPALSGHLSLCAKTLMVQLGHSSDRQPRAQLHLEPWMQLCHSLGLSFLIYTCMDFRIGSEAGARDLKESVST